MKKVIKWPMTRKSFMEMEFLLVQKNMNQIYAEISTKQKLQKRLSEFQQFQRHKNKNNILTTITAYQVGKVLAKKIKI